MSDLPFSMVLLGVYITSAAWQEAAAAPEGGRRETAPSAELRAGPRTHNQMTGDEVQEAEAAFISKVPKGAPSPSSSPRPARDAASRLGRKPGLQELKLMSNDNPLLE